VAYAVFRLNVKGGDLMQAIVGPDIFRNVLTGSRYAFADTALGVAIAVHFIGAKNLSATLETIISSAERPIRWLSSYTFSIYLMHFPLLFLFTLAFDHDPARPLTPWLAIVPTLGVIFVISFFTEQKRHLIKPAVSALWLIWMKPPLRRAIYVIVGPQKIAA
jgi:peptidoglycan/LPS O-acetylase OafA/YrhL